MQSPTAAPTLNGHPSKPQPPTWAVPWIPRSHPCFAAWGTSCEAPAPRCLQVSRPWPCAHVCGRKSGSLLGKQSPPKPFLGHTAGLESRGQPCSTHSSGQPGTRTHTPGLALGRSWGTLGSLWHTSLGMGCPLHCLLQPRQEVCSGCSQVCLAPESASA